MGSYKLIEHTADVRMWVEAATKEALFAAAMKGMAMLMSEDICKTAVLNEFVSLQVTSVDCTALLIDFLNEVLTQSHIKQVVFCDMSVAMISDTALSATVVGAATQGFEEDIKSVTYHEAAVVYNEALQQYETMIVFDI